MQTKELKEGARVTRFYEVQLTSAGASGQANQSRSITLYWMVFAAVTLTVILAAAIHWSLAHPFGIHWDEAGYLDQALIDVQRLRHGMLLKLAGRILLKSHGRPPAYRMLADPFLAIFGTGTTTARLVSLACFGLTALYINLAARQIGSRIAGAFAVILFCLSPDVIAASMFFSTDAPLYLAVSATLYYLFKSLASPVSHTRDWVGLGLAISLGFLSKTSFFLIGPPAIAFWLVAARRMNSGNQGFVLPLKAGLLALLVTGPWWLLNVKEAMDYTRYARGFVRNSLGPQSLSTWLKWFNTVFQCLLGHGTSIVIGLVLIACLARVIVSRETILTSLQRSALGICACAGAPVILAQLFGTNHLLRHISPAVIPLAISIGVLADQTLWTHRIPMIVVPSILFCAQLLMLLYPVAFPNTKLVEIGFVNGALPWRTMPHFDQWDWGPLREIGNACNIDSPTISFMGGGREFNPPAMQYPWAAAGVSTRLSIVAYPDVNWLWRYEDGPVNWLKVMNSADQSDFVVTAPNYIGEVTTEDDEDNLHNSEFADRLSTDPHFQKPILFQTGRFAPIEILVYPRQNLVCNVEQSGFPKPKKE